MLACGLDPAVWNEERRKEMNPDLTQPVSIFSVNDLLVFISMASLMMQG
jgi:hypothetical protein